MKKSLNVLVVDDDRMMVKTICDILEISGFNCIKALNASDALELLSTNEIDCVLTDIKMPNMNGAEFFREIRQRDSEIPVVLMTAYAKNELVDQALIEGAMSVLNKPLDINILLNFLNLLERELYVLIVDDNYQFCKTMADLLKLRDINVAYYTDYSELDGRIWSEGEILIVDLNLKRISGYDLMKKIRSEFPFLPVIIVTGYRNEHQETIDMAISDSAFTCLFKPVDINELISTINRLIKYELKKKLGFRFNKKR